MTNDRLIELTSFKGDSSNINRTPPKDSVAPEKTVFKNYLELKALNTKWMGA